MEQTAPLPLSPAKTGALRRVAGRAQGRYIARIALVVAIVISLLAELGWWRLTATDTHYSGAHFNQGLNAIWVAHTWSGAYHSPAEYDALAQRLQREQIRYVYAHVGPLEGDGTVLATRAPFAANFVQAMHARAPQMQILAWLGGAYRPGAQPGENVLDLASPVTRQHITQVAAHFTHDLGFDGVHYDIEPILNNDNHFLDLLDETRQAIGGGSVLSIATPNWVPIARVTEVLNSFTGRQDVWWTTYYYQAVSKHVDQIVAMMYNTGMPTAPLYEAIVQQETAHILSNIEQVQAPAQVIVGIPTFRGPSSRAFHASAENMRTGLTGLISGLNDALDHDAFAGVAIYSEWETTTADWSVYEHDWLGQ